MRWEITLSFDVKFCCKYICAEILLYYDNSCSSYSWYCLRSFMGLNIFKIRNASVPPNLSSWLYILCQKHDSNLSRIDCIEWLFPEDTRSETQHMRRRTAAVVDVLGGARSLLYGTCSTGCPVICPLPGQVPPVTCPLGQGPPTWSDRVRSRPKG